MIRLLVYCLLLLLLPIGCRSTTTADPILRYKVAHPNGDPFVTNDLPKILPLPPVDDREAANTDEWYRLAQKHELVGKSIDDAIVVYGQDYLISLYKGRKEPRMYYHLAGTHSWGIYGVIVLDPDLRIRRITTDPED